MADGLIVRTLGSMAMEPVQPLVLPPAPIVPFAPAITPFPILQPAAPAMVQLPAVIHRRCRP